MSSCTCGCAACVAATWCDGAVAVSGLVPAAVWGASSSLAVRLYS